MNVTFYSKFKKRINSTKRPSGGVDKEVLIKEKCDLHSPVLKIQGTAGQFNYFQIGNAYYFVSGETVMPNGWIEYQGTVDAMATCADDIKSTTAFVIRSAAGNTDLIDSFAPAQTKSDILYEAEKMLFTPSETGTYVVSIAGSVGPIAMTFGQFLELYHRLNSKDVVEQIENVFANFSDYVKGAFWVPYNLNTFGTIHLKAGTVELGIEASNLSSAVQTADAVFTLPLTDDALSSSQYTSIKLQLPHCGTVNLSIDDFRSRKSVYIHACMDAWSGRIQYAISSGNNIAPVASFTGDSSVPIPLGSTAFNVVGGIASTVGGLVSGSVPAAIAGMASMFIPQYSTSQAGGSGSRQDILSAVVGVYRHEPPEKLENKRSIVGLPTMKTLSLGSLSGFVQCANASIQSTEEPDIVSQCNNYLNSGAWIE